MKLDKKIIGEIARLSPIEALSDALFLHTRDYDTRIHESSVMVWAQIIQNNPVYVNSISTGKELRMQKLARLKVLLAALIHKEVITEEFKELFDKETAVAQKEFYLVAQNYAAHEDSEEKDDAKS